MPPPPPDRSTADRALPEARPEADADTDAEVGTGGPARPRSRPQRLRLGVAVMVEPPVGDEVDGLRRALGDPSLGRIDAHITLVPPINVRASELPAALRRLRAAAATQAGPLRLIIGPAATFLPANPVLYLAVGGDAEGLRALREAVFATPLDRPLSWPWVPHVTLLDGGDPDRIRAATQVIAGYRATVEAERVVLLQERRRGPGERVWLPLADAALGRPARIGTGGLAVEIVAGRLPDPELAALAEAAGEQPEQPEQVEPVEPVEQARKALSLPSGAFGLPLVLTAHREGAPVGAAISWVDRDGSGEAIYVLPEHRRQGIGAQLLAHLRHRSAPTGAS